MSSMSAFNSLETYESRESAGIKKSLSKSAFSFLKNQTCTLFNHAQNASVMHVLRSSDGGMHYLKGFAECFLYVHKQTAPEDKRS